MDENSSSIAVVCKYKLLYYNKRSLETSSNLNWIDTKDEDSSSIAVPSK